MTCRRNLVTCQIMAVILWLFGVDCCLKPLWARPLEAEPEQLFFLLDETVTTASKFLQPVSEAPSTVMVVTEQTIRERGYRNLVDVLKDLPGFDVWDHIGGQAGGSYVISRGLWGNNKIQVFKDGIPLNPANGTHLVYGNHISVRGLKQIEIIYGPSSALYGADAFSAIINLITKDLETTRQYEGQIQAGNNDTFAGYMLLGQKDPSKDISVQFYGHGYRTSGFDLRKEYKDYRLDDGYGNLTPFYRLDRPFEAPEQDFDLTLKAEAGLWEFMGLWYRTRQPNNIQTPYYTGRSQLSKDKVEIDTYDLSLHHDMDIWDDLELKTCIGWQFYELDPESDYGRYTFDNYIYERSRAWRFEEQLTFRNTFAGTIVAGFKVERISTFPYINSRSPFDGGDTYSDFPIYAIQKPDGTMVNIKPVEKLAYWTYGLYLQISRYMLPRISMTIGGRYDINTFNHHTSFTPRAGLVYHVSPTQHIKLMYARSYISPSAYFQYKAWAGDSYAHLPAFYFSEHLKPERLESLELSYSLVASRLSLDVSGYVSQARNMIQEASATFSDITLFYKDGSVVSGATVEIPGNSGTQKTVGLDLLGKVRIYCNWSAYLYYSYMDAQIHKKGEDYWAPKVSMHKLGFGITGILYNRLGIHLRGRWWSGIYTMPTNPLYQGRKLKGHMILDANIRWLRIFPNTDLTLTINNLLDEKYFTAGNETENHTSGASLPMVPQNPREILIGLSYHF